VSLARIQVVPVSLMLAAQREQARVSLLA